MLRAPLAERVPAVAGEAAPETLLDAFLEYVGAKGLDPYAHQEEAILELLSGRNVILNTPTGSGKSLVGYAACFRAVASGGRAFYTAPIKALVNEKFFDLCRELGPERVGMMTGDASVNRDAPVVCCTAEILMNLALAEGEGARLTQVVMDEFHFYAERERGVAWQVPLLCLPQAQFLLMSATLGDTRFFERDLSERTGRETVVVRSAERPVPLDFEYRETPLQETVADLVDAGEAPVYIVHFTQRAASERAQGLTSLNVLTTEQKREVRKRLGQVRFDSPFGKELRRYLGHGIGVHHAGLLPKYRRLVERMAQEGWLRIICGTDTLGVGVNIPIRTVLFTQLCKYDGERTRVLSVRDFQQIAGRAGRRGYDDHGKVVAQAPEHAVENRILRAKAGNDPKKMRKLKLKKPPDRGYAHWDRQTFDRLVNGEPERLESRFQVNHGMMLQVLSREQGGCGAMKALIRGCHESDAAKHHHARHAIQLFGALVRAGIVELVPKGRGPGKRAEVCADLQIDFSLHQQLGLYVVEALAAVDREAEDYPVAVLALVEAILEDPTVVLRRQRDKRKDEALAEMKAEGLEYEERMKRLDEIDHPKPYAELIYGTFDAFAEHHPWVGSENIRPKGVVREMWDGGFSFRDFVKEHGLARSEGVLLRYLSSAYKVLVQTVPEDAKTDPLYDLTEWLGTLVRGVDSSLIEEWERLSDPEHVREALERGEGPEPTAEEASAADVTADRRGFTALVRNAAWRLVLLMARRDHAAMAEQIGSAEGQASWTADRVQAEVAPYWEEHDALVLDQDARAPKNCRIEEGGETWRVTQVVTDPEGDRDYALELWVDLARSREEGAPVITHLTLQGGT
ncbi:MAG: DEAD/DEAH box helicase [Myxococcota bacterium]